MPARLVRWVLLPVVTTALALAAAPNRPDTASIDVPAIDLREFQRQRLELLLEGSQPGLSAPQRAVVAREFLNHLRRTAKLTSERVERGQVDDDELRTRLGVFLGDHPELHGGAPQGDAASRVIAVLRKQPDVPADDNGLRALAAAFLQRLSQRQRGAAEALAAGRMPPEEIESRLAVFLADRRAESSARSGTATAAVALEALSERFVAHNFGRPAERVRSLALRGTAEENGRRRDFVLFRRHPNRVRLHYVENGIVVSALGFDGERAWRQDAAGRALFLSGADARALRELAEFDHPLIDAAARHTRVRLTRGDPAGTSEVELELDRGELGTLVSVMDPVTAEERSVVRLAAGGQRQETRLSDYHCYGALNLPQRQETWEGGKLKRTVVIDRVETEPGFLTEFFSRPDTGRFAFMDFMGALEVVRRKQAAAEKPAGAAGVPVEPPAKTVTQVVAGGAR